MPHQAVEKAGSAVTSDRSFAEEIDSIVDSIIAGVIGAVIGIYYAKMIEPANGDYPLKLVLSLVFVIGCFLVLKLVLRFTRTIGRPQSRQRPSLQRRLQSILPEQV